MSESTIGFLAGLMIFGGIYMAGTAKGNPTTILLGILLTGIGAALAATPLP